MEPSFAFTLRVSGIDTSSDRYEDALYEAGCDDALISVVDGVLYLDFDREAPTRDRAVQMASENVRRAGGQVEEVLPIRH